MRRESRDGDVNRSSRLGLLPYDQNLGISYKAFTVQRATWFPLVTFSFLRRRSARTASILRPFQLIVPTRRKRNDAAILSKLHFPYLCDDMLILDIFDERKEYAHDDSRNTVEIRIFCRLTRFRFTQVEILATAVDSPLPPPPPPLPCRIKTCRREREREKLRVWSIHIELNLFAKNSRVRESRWFAD